MPRAGVFPPMRSCGIVARHSQAKMRWDIPSMGGGTFHLVAVSWKWWTISGVYWGFWLCHNIVTVFEPLSLGHYPLTCLWANANFICLHGEFPGKSLKFCHKNPHVAFVTWIAGVALCLYLRCKQNQHAILIQKFYGVRNRDIFKYQYLRCPFAFEGSNVSWGYFFFDDDPWGVMVFPKLILYTGRIVFRGQVFIHEYRIQILKFTKNI